MGRQSGTDTGRRWRNWGKENKDRELKSEAGLWGAGPGLSSTRRTAERSQTERVKASALPPRKARQLPWWLQQLHAAKLEMHVPVGDKWYGQYIYWWAEKSETCSWCLQVSGRCASCVTKAKQNSSHHLLEWFFPPVLASVLQSMQRKTWTEDKASRINL